MSDHLDAIDKIQGAIRRLEALAELVAHADRLPNGHGEGLADLLSDCVNLLCDAVELIHHPAPCPADPEDLHHG
jgi:hypothetical protein